MPDQGQPGLRAAALFGRDRKPYPLAQGDEQQAGEQDGETTEAEDNPSKRRLSPGRVPEGKLRERPVGQEMAQKVRNACALDGGNAQEKKEKRHGEVDEVAQAGQIMSAGQQILNLLRAGQAVACGQEKRPPVAAQDAERSVAHRPCWAK